ncbi:MAG: GntR family transcriptional regulator [Limisphaerales bacterium]
MENHETTKVLRVDLASPTPVYRQIADGLRALLVHGDLKPGGRLPTVRQIAVDLAVHHNTVAQAYRLLAEEGWLDLRRHRGATVIERPSQRPSADSREDFSQRLRELTARAVADGLDAKSIAQQLGTLANELNK